MEATIKKLRKVIQAHRYRSQIDTKVAAVFSRDSDKHRTIMTAIDMVTETHDNGRRHNGEFLKSHEFAMFALAFQYCKVRDLSVLLAILLHDMHEDYPEIWSIDLIRDRYGMKVAEIVHAVTKPERSLFESEDELDRETFNRVAAGGERALQVKCVDRLHNMLTLFGSREKQVKKIFQTVKYVLPLSAECEFLTYELMIATSEQMKRLKVNHSLL